MYCASGCDSCIGSLQQSRVDPTHPSTTQYVLMCFSGSTSCTFHILTPNRPLVLSGNEHLTFAPYHTHYPRLEEHMAAAGLQAKPNLWDNPLSIGKSPVSYRRSSTDT